MKKSRLINFLIYKRPASEEGFELLEDNYEDKETQKISADEYKDTNSNENNTVQRGKRSIRLRREKSNLNDNCINEKGNVSKEIDINKSYIKDMFSLPQNQDIVIREFNIAHKTKAVLVLWMEW
jgi:hypothetical protein